MREHTEVRIKGTLWQAIALKAGRDKMSPEDWLQRQLHDQDPKTPPGASEDDLLLDLSIRHFRVLDLTHSEARDLATAILQTAATGTPAKVGPVGSCARYYEFQRRVAALSIRVGEGRIKLPLQAALQLAGALQNHSESQHLDNIAA